MRVLNTAKRLFYKRKDSALILQDLRTRQLIVNREVAPNATLNITSNMYETAIRNFI